MQHNLYGMGETQTADEKVPPDLMTMIMMIMLIRLTLDMMMMRF